MIGWVALWAAVGYVKRGGAGQGPDAELGRPFPGNSRVSVLLRSLDWSATDLGPPGRWPENLRTAVSICPASRLPILIWWGRNQAVLDNVASIPIPGESKYPRQLGRPGRECWDVIRTMLESVRATGEAMLSHGLPFCFARNLLREEVHVRSTNGSILGSDGRPVEGILTPCTETTEHVAGVRCFERFRRLGVRPAEEAPRESEARFRNMADHAPVMIWVTDPTGACTYVNEHWCRFTGTAPEQGFGFGWLDSVHDQDRQEAELAFRDANARRGAFRVEYRVRRHDGEYRSVLDSAAPRFGPAGEFLGYIGSVLDVTEEKRAEEEVLRARDQLELRVRERTAELSEALAALERQERTRRDLLRRIVTVQEDERRRISRELHDQMGQQLTALMLRLRLAKDSAGEDSPMREQLNWLEDHAALIGQDIHRIALELRPTALDDLGLPAALAQHAEEWSRRFGVIAEVRVNGLEAYRLPTLVETTIYRAVQEAMTNVLKHAAAERVVVTMNRMRGYVSVIIEDDGKGFDGDRAMDPGSRDRIGLLGMKERVSFAGGTLAIESRPGAGTSLLIRIPIQEHEEGP